MICSTCAKLGTIYKSTKCKICGIDTNIKSYLLCSTCSEKEQKCACCLKKVYDKTNHPIYKLQLSGCQSCKKNK